MESLRPHDPRRIGPYRLRGRLGAGGMGEVFLASSADGCDVVVKVIRPELAETAGARRRFAREIAAARRVGGPRTARVVDAAPDADPPWMVTEYIPGLSLQQMVGQSGRLSAENLRALAVQLGEGLAAIHACGLVHRDLKPGNVIVADDGARIIDFGVALMDDASTLTATGAVIGTFAFMSPEQVHSGEVGPASDVFSLGGVLAFAGTGRSPFAAASIPAIVHRIVTAEPDLGTVGGELRGLIAACLAKDPADRPAVPDLLGWLSGVDGAARIPAPPSNGAAPAGGDGGEQEPPRAVRERRPDLLARRRLLLAGLAGTAALAVPPVILATRDAGAKPKSAPAPRSRPAVFAGSLSGHGAVVCSVCFSPDGATLASGGVDGPVLLWKVATGERLRTLEGHSYPVISIAFGPDGTSLITGAELVRIWNVAAGRQVSSIATQQRTGFDSQVDSLAVSADGRYLATDGPGGALVWATGTGRVVRTLTGDAVRALAFTSGGRVLVGGGRGLRMWNVASGATIRTFATTSGAIHSIALGPGGHRLAGSGDTSPVRLWDLASDGGPRAFTGMGNTSGPLAFSPDGKFLASAPAADAAGAEQITVWNVATGQPDRILDGHTGGVNALAFHPSGTALASASQDRTVRLWKLA